MGSVVLAKATKDVAFEGEVKRVVDLKVVAYFLDLDEAYVEAEDPVDVTSVIVDLVVGTSVTVQKRIENQDEVAAVKEVLATKEAAKAGVVWYLLRG